MNTSSLKKPFAAANVSFWFALFALIPVAYVWLEQAYQLYKLVTFIGLTVPVYIILLWRNGEKGFQFPVSAFSIFLLLFIGCCFLSINFAYSPKVSLHLSLFLAFAMGNWWVYQQIDNKENFWKCWSALFLAFCVFSAIYGLFFSDDFRSSFNNKNNHIAFINLGAFLAVGYLMRQWVKERSLNWIKIILLTPVVMLFFYYAIRVGCRGAVLGTQISLIVLALAHFRQVKWQGWLWLAASYSASFLLGNIVSNNTLISRATRHIPREQIWTKSVNLLHDSPWYGIGLNNYYLIFPHYSDYTDLSSLFYAHNDYYQFLIELGYQGFIAITCLLFALAWQWFKYLRREQDALKSISVTSAFVALLCVATHSFVTFNFMVPVIPVTMGWFLGRVYYATMPENTRILSWRPGRNPTISLYKAMLFMFALVPMTFVALAGGSEWKMHVAMHDLGPREYAQYESNLKAADSLYPRLKTKVALGTLYKEIVDSNGLKDKAAKKKFYDEALYYFNSALGQDKTAPMTRMAIAQLYLAYPEFSGPDFKKKAEYQLEKAVYFQPRSAAARFNLARLLIEEGQIKRATYIVNEGFKYNLWKEKEDSVVGIKLRGAAKYLGIKLHRVTTGKHAMKKDKWDEVEEKSNLVAKQFFEKYPNKIKG